MGSSNSRALPSLARFPKLQRDLKKIYRALHPLKTLEQRNAWTNSLTNETRIQAVLGEFELEVYGANADGTPRISGGNNVVARVERLKRKLNL